MIAPGVRKSGQVKIAARRRSARGSRITRLIVDERDTETGAERSSVTSALRHCPRRESGDGTLPVLMTQDISIETTRLRRNARMKEEIWSIDRRRRRAAIFLPALVALFVLASCGKRESTEPRMLRKPLPTPGITGLPDSGFQVAWVSVKHPDRLVAGTTVPFEVSFRNTSDQVWPDVPTSADPATGGGSVRLSYRIRRAGGGDVVREYLNRADMNGPLNPGGTATLHFDVELPGKPGRYEVQFDLVQEFVAWFEAKGAAPNITEIEVVAPR